MSYCRWSEGDVYMYHSIGGYIECCACILQLTVPSIFTKGGDIFGKTHDACEVCDGEFYNERGEPCEACGVYGCLHIGDFKAAIEHLHAHRTAGHEVPERAFEMLQADMDAGVVLTDINLRPVCETCGGTKYITIKDQKPMSQGGECYETTLPCLDCKEEE